MRIFLSWKNEEAEDCYGNEENKIFKYFVHFWREGK